MYLRGGWGHRGNEFSIIWKSQFSSLNKTILLSQNLKDGENEVALFSHFEPKQARYGHFLIFKLFKRQNGKIEKNGHTSINLALIKQVWLWPQKAPGMCGQEPLMY